MKKTIFIFMIALLLGTFIGQKIRQKYVPPDGFYLISQSEIDSINNIAPDTIVVDSVVFQKQIIFKDRYIYSEAKKNGTNVYKDSIINDSTHLIIIDTIDGTLLNRKIELLRNYRYRELRVPYPQYLTVTKYAIDKPKFSLYFGGLMFGNERSFMTGGEGGYISSENIQYGVFFATDFNEKYIGVSIKKIFDF